MTVPVKVFLVDDHALFRAGVKAELADLADERIAVAGEAGSVGEAVARITADPPDVVLLDVHMPDGGGRAVLADAGEWIACAAWMDMDLPRGELRDVLVGVSAPAALL